MQIEEKHIPDYDHRINVMKDQITNTTHVICVERAKYFTESYKKTKGEPPVIRFAKAMEHYLENMTISISNNEYIVGNRTTKTVGTPLYPEVRIDSIRQDIDTYEKRPVQKLLISEEDKNYLKNEIIPYWSNEEKTVRKHYIDIVDDKAKEIMEKLVFTVDVQMTNGIGHFFPGHHNVLKYGLQGLYEKANKELNKINKNSPSELINFYNSVVITLNASMKFILRFSELAKQLASSEEDIRRKKELIEIADNCKFISKNPPKTFKQALQLIYFNQLICGLEDGGFAISVGRLDQDLYKYYQNDKRNGLISDTEIDFLLKCFFIKLSSIYNYVFSLAVNAGEGPPIAENLTIGGLTREGNDAVNDLSYLILDAYKDLQTVQPTFSVRVSKKTPKDFLIKVGKSIKDGASIALFNDEVMVPGMVNRGFALKDAREYAPVGCVEPQHPYKSFGSTNSNQLNIVKCLELALTNGKDMFSRKTYGIQRDEPIRSYEQLWKVFEMQVQFFIKQMVANMNALDRAIAELNPQPFLSATTNNCLQIGADVTRGGAKYNFTGPQLIGLATCADSLAVIKKIVFEDETLTLEELITMLQKNYRGTYRNKKGSVWREIFINRIPKFGNDDDFVDEIAADIVKLYSEEVAKYNNYRGGKFNPGIYSTSLHLAFGTFTGASADGRKSRDPLSNGVGPTHGRDKNGPTAICNSVKKLENELLTNGHSLILAFHPKTMKEDIFLPLVRTYFESEGGFQVQFNVVGKETLCEAQNHPEDHQGLVVRIAGYSVYFTELSKGAQDEIISRTEY